MTKPKPPSQRDRGYSNILHHLTKSEKKQSRHYLKLEKLLKQLIAALK